MFKPATRVGPEGGVGGGGVRPSLSLDVGKILPGSQGTEAWIGWILRAPESANPGYQYAGTHKVPQITKGDVEIRPLKNR